MDFEDEEIYEHTNLNRNFNLCDLGGYINNIKGLPSNSSSPTDTWIVKFKNNTTFERVPIKHGFLKIFVDTDMLITKTDAKLALQYELNIYKTTINNLVIYNICPNFLECLALGENCSFDSLLNILKGKLYNLSFTELISEEECKMNLNRNIYYLVNEKNENEEKRPAIQSHEPIPLPKPIDYSKYRFKYNMMLLENMEDSITFHRWLVNHFRRGYNNVEFYNVLFQIAVACYAMSLSKMVHNDLHLGNIFIKDLGIETYFMYNINDTKIVIKTRFQPLIYDFDRAYSETLGINRILTRTHICKEFSQCNVFIENKDIVKVMCYVYNIANTDEIKNDIMSIVSKDIISSVKLRSSYELLSQKGGERKKKCFLQYLDSDGIVSAIPDEMYITFSDSLSIIEKISLKLPSIYSESDVNSENNIFNCNKNFFNEDGTLNIIKATEAKLNIERRIFSDIKGVYSDEKINNSNELHLSGLENISLTTSQLNELNELISTKSLDAGRKRKSKSIKNKNKNKKSKRKYNNRR